MWLPCRCENLHEPKFGCDMVYYHPQDIAKAERLGIEEGLDPGILYAYKLCENCKFDREDYVFKSRASYGDKA